MTEEDKGFTVRDRRAFTDDGAPRQDQDQERPAAEAANQEQTEAEPSGTRHLPPVDFGAFIFSLSHAAMMHLGHIPDPHTGQTAADPELARHTIDTIAMLKEKTQGNLSQDEQLLIDHALTELRLAYVRQHG